MLPFMKNKLFHLSTLNYQHRSGFALKNTNCLRIPSIATLTLLILLLAFNSKAHEVTFCNERVPMSEDFVVNKLMNIIRKQMAVANLPSVRKTAELWFGFFDKVCRYYKIPEDLKYIPIVESGFRNVQSPVGAAGWWQIMPETAREYDLTINPPYRDDRNNPEKATYAACKLLHDSYNVLKQKTVTPSWILVAASYNYGTGNMMKFIRSQGPDYFKMNLNRETSDYVYKLIAIKELFEHPDIYSSGFGRNVFSDATEKPTTISEKVPVTSVKKKELNTEVDLTDFNPINLEKARSIPIKKEATWYLSAHIVPLEDGYTDGDMVRIELEDDLDIPGEYKKKGNQVKGHGWLIDNRVFVYLGYKHVVEVLDGNFRKGIPISDIDKADKKIILKVTCQANEK